MACACKAKKTGQVTQFKQIVKGKVVSTSKTQDTRSKQSTPTTKRVVKKIMRRPAY